MLPNLSDYSRRCERQFRSKNEIIEVWDRPRDHSIVEFRNIFIVLAQMVRPFELVNWRLIPSSSFVSRRCVNLNLVNSFKTSHLITRLQKVREPDQLFECLSSGHPILPPSSFSSSYVKSVNCFKASLLIIPSHPLHLSLGCTWIVWTLLIWSSYLFIRRQLVRELDHFLE